MSAEQLRKRSVSTAALAERVIVGLKRIGERGCQPTNSCAYREEIPMTEGTP